MTSVRTLQVGDRVLDVAFRHQPRIPGSFDDPPVPEGVEIEAVWEEGLEAADTTQDEEDEIVRQIKEIAREYV